jgi:hypothetical protein
VPPAIVTIEIRDPGTGEASRDAYEVTPPAAPGEEHALLVELVTSLHPCAVLSAYADGVATFGDGARRITASYREAADGTARGGGADAPSQGRLFDA